MLGLNVGKALKMSRITTVHKRKMVQIKWLVAYKRGGRLQSVGSKSKMNELDCVKNESVLIKFGGEDE